MVWAVSAEDADTLTSFRDSLGLSYPVLVDDQGVHETWSQISSVMAAAYPQQWIVGTDGKIAYVAAEYTPDAVTAVLDEQLAR